MDTIVSDTPAINGSETWAQLFVGTKSLLSDAYGMKTPANFSSTLMDNNTQRSAPTKLISNHAQAEISNCVKEILRTLFNGAWQSEPNKQHQSFAERRNQDIKKMVNVVLDHSGAPAYCWLLCLQYVCYVLNNCHLDNIGCTPLCAATGRTNDVSPLLRYTFYEAVYYTDKTAPSLLAVRSEEAIGLE